MYDSYGDVDRVPELLARAEREDDAAAWDELGYRLNLESDLVFPPVSPRCRVWCVWRRKTPGAWAGGAIIRCGAGDHGCDELLAGCAEAITEFRGLLDRHLRSRPDDYLTAFRDLIAAEGHYHWSAVLGDFSDDFYEVACPHCAVAVTIAIGGYGRYSAIRDWNLGDVDRRDLKPALSEIISGTGRRMHEIAVRDGQSRLADGIAHLYGQAECPRCASVFIIADEYESAHRPLV
ncbi:hypothetical protein ACR6C2_28890 [Streptomyces sp. INA 01156]